MRRQFSQETHQCVYRPIPQHSEVSIEHRPNRHVLMWGAEALSHGRDKGEEEMELQALRE